MVSFSFLGELFLETKLQLSTHKQTFSRILEVHTKVKSKQKAVNCICQKQQAKTISCVTVPNSCCDRDIYNLSVVLIHAVFRTGPLVPVTARPHSAHPLGVCTEFYRNKNVIAIPLHTPIKEDTWTYRRWGYSIQHKALLLKSFLGAIKSVHVKRAPGTALQLR